MGNLFDLFHLWNHACLLNPVFLGYRLLSSPGKAATRDLPYRRSPGGRQRISLAKLCTRKISADRAPPIGPLPVP
jgi:hypothetical protein